MDWRQETESINLQNDHNTMQTYIIEKDMLGRNQLCQFHQLMRAMHQHHLDCMFQIVDHPMNAYQINMPQIILYRRTVYQITKQRNIYHGREVSFQSSKCML